MKTQIKIITAAILEDLENKTNKFLLSLPMSAQIQKIEYSERTGNAQMIIFYLIPNL